MKRLRSLILAMIMMPLTIMAQSYDGLWKQVDEAERQDLPETQIKVLRQIVAKAERERAYGQLLKAGLMQARVQAMVAPDSLLPAVERLEQRAGQTADTALQAVYYAVLGKVYQSNSRLSDDWKSISKTYFSKAMEHPAKLAAVKADGYKPFVVTENDSQLYGDDLLSLIGYETRQYRPMHEYYLTTDNRRAQLLSALYMLGEESPDDFEKLSESDYIRRLDSLTNNYADLTECGEVAIERYEYMNNQTDATAEQKIACIDEALSRWGTWQRMNVLRNARQELTYRQFSAVLEHRVWIPNRTQEIRLEDLRGIGQLTIRIYKVKADGDITLYPEDKDDYKELKPLLTPLPELTQTRSYGVCKDYELFGEKLELPALPVGVYMMEVESQPQTDVARSLFFVSDVRVLAQQLPGGRSRYVVVSATTGKPLPKAQLRLYRRSGYRERKVLATLKTDNQGEYLYHYNEERPHEAFATFGDDKACPMISSAGYFSYYDNKRTVEQVAVYTDRAIYRPGQTVQVAAIVYQVKDGIDHDVKSGKSVTVSLRDANGKMVEERQVLTDELGTLSTQFTLPATALTGLFTVQVGSQSQNIRVEAYKRPTFQVEFPKVSQDYADGDTLKVQATAMSYAGVPVQGARVRYKVVRRMAFWWLSYYSYWQEGYYGVAQQDVTLMTGEAVTGEDGVFSVLMPMVLPKTKYPLFCNFVVTADVTDQSGETHQAQLSLPLGNRKTAITTTLPDKVLAEEKPTMKLRVLNAAGNDIGAAVRYQIDGGKWMTAQSDTPVQLPKLKSGRHVLKAEYEDEKMEREFVVFSLGDKRPAIETDDWFYVSDQQFSNDGTPVILQAGASGNVHIVYTLVAGNTTVEQAAADLSDELINRKLTYKPEYGNGLTLSYAWVREGKTYTHSVQIQRPLPDKRLTMKWETFRDRLTPGQQEEWVLKIESPYPRTSETSLIATLYDKSLDQLVAHNWSLKPQTWLPMASLRWNFGNWGSTSCHGYEDWERLPYSDLSFTHFNTECFPYPWLQRRPKMVSRTMVKNQAVEMEELSMAAPLAKHEVAVGAQKAIGAFDVAGNDKADDTRNRRADEKMQAEPEVQMRENLQETAFFYPQLLADSTGRVSMRFTLPESLTTWRFMGIAHTKDMMYGFIESEAVAQKDVMIQPNMPRFLRMGDKATITARVINMTESDLQGTVGLQIIDPETEQTLYSTQTACRLKANGTETARFEVQGSRFAGKSLLICRMTVATDKHSDGEQHYLPLLPDRERVTVTVPFTQNEPGVKTVDLSGIMAASENAKLTVEYTNNPAWLVLQALPAIGKPCDKNAISQAAALYANGLGSYIMAQNPQARHVFEMWKQEQTPATSLTSQLEKDQELKDLVLDETPWVTDADCESEQKQRLADFFDTNLIQQRQQSAIAQLRKLQNGDGSWSWWEGMRGSFYMTVEVSEMLVRLRAVVGQQSALAGETDKMLTNAFKYMNKEILELVDEMKRQEKKGVRQTFPTYKALQYLYLSTLDGRQQPAKVQQAHKYLKDLLKKDMKKQTIYEKAVSAIVLHAPSYIKSLKEYTVYKEEMGRYYDTPRAAYSWFDYRIPTQVAAIEAIRRLSPSDTVTISEMQRWLLQQKRTQAWDTPVNSVDAVCAFLDGRSYLLSAQPKTVLKVDGRTMDTSEATAGIGYVKTSMTAAELGGEPPKTFTAEKTSTGTSWGAVYAQFMQPVSQIADHKSGMSIKREIILKDKAKRPMKVGDRVTVRLVIEADRDYDFVQVADKRAACMEPVQQLSGYDWRTGCYRAPKDNATNYFFDRLAKGRHVVETEYFIDRAGSYETGTCTVQCAYAPEYRGTAKSQTLQIEPNDNDDK